MSPHPFCSSYYPDDDAKCSDSNNYYSVHTAVNVCIPSMMATVVVSGESRPCWSRLYVPRCLPWWILVSSLQMPSNSHVLPSLFRGDRHCDKIPDNGLHFLLWIGDFPDWYLSAECRVLRQIPQHRCHPHVLSHCVCDLFSDHTTTDWVLRQG